MIVVSWAHVPALLIAMPPKKIRTFLSRNDRSGCPVFVGVPGFCLTASIDAWTQACEMVPSPLLMLGFDTMSPRSVNGSRVRPREVRLLWRRRR